MLAHVAMNLAFHRRQCPVFDNDHIEPIRESSFFGSISSSLTDGITNVCRLTILGAVSCPVGSEQVLLASKACPKLGIGIRMSATLYAHPQHIKVVKHFIYVYNIDVR